jgi:hypothetical protein
MRKSTLSFVLAGCLAVPLVALAASPMKPGLWEVTVKTGEAKTSKSDSLFNSLGSKMSNLMSGLMSTKVCYTKKSLQRDQVPGQESQECRTTSMKHSGNKFWATMVCDGKNLKGKGKSSGTINSKNFTVKSSFQGVSNGQKISYSTEATGKYISSQCGDVKPVQ